VVVGGIGKRVGRRKKGNVRICYRGGEGGQGERKLLVDSPGGDAKPEGGQNHGLQRKAAVTKLRGTGGGGRGEKGSRGEGRGAVENPDHEPGAAKEPGGGSARGGQVESISSKKKKREIWRVPLKSAANPSGN